MSYANAASKNSAGGGAQPSSEFLEGSNAAGGANAPNRSVDVDSNKVNVVPSDSQLEHLKTETRDAADKAKKFASDESEHIRREAKKAEKSLSKKTKEVSAQVQEGWKHLSSDPKAWGTLLGAVNLAVLGGLGYFVYKERANIERWDRRVVSAVSVGVLGLLGGQGYVAAETARKQQGKK